MAKSRDYIPKNDAVFNVWFKNLYQYVGQKTSGASPEWTHIPKDAVEELGAAYQDWYTKYSLTTKPHTKAENVEKDEAKAAAIKVIRPFVQQWLRFKPVINSDRVNMGLPIYDETRTIHGAPTEQAEFFFKLTGIREITVHFKVLGAEGRAKPSHYAGALIKWAVLDKPPSDIEELTHHELASKTPHTLKFKESERGKTVYVALAWQNGKGDLGPYSEIQSAVIP
jgi:hypothetical protein